VWANGNIRAVLTGRDTRPTNGASARGRNAVGRRPLVTLWLLCAVFGLMCATSASGQRTDVVDTNVILRCGDNSYPLVFAHHRAKIGEQEAEALSVILRSSARPNKVFSLYRYGSDGNNMRRDDDKGKAAQIEYKSTELGNYVNNFLASSFGKSFDRTRCSQAGLIAPVLASFSTSSVTLFEVVNGILPGAKPAQGSASPFSGEPASDVKFPETVFKFGEEWGFGGGDVDLSKEELIRQRDEAERELAGVKVKFETTGKALGDAQKKLDAATRQASVRWWIVLGTLGYGLLVTLAWLSLVGKSIKERKLRPAVGPGAKASYPAEIKAALLRLVEDTDRRCAQIAEQSNKRNDPLLDRDEFRREHIGLVERVETLFLSNGYVVPEGLDDLLTRAKKQFYSPWQLVPVVGSVLNRVRDALRRGSSTAYNLRHSAKSDYRDFVQALENYADGLSVKEDAKTEKELPAENGVAKGAVGATTTQTKPEPARHELVAESREALASTVKDAFSTQVNPVLKQTVEDTIKAAFNARSGEWIDLVKSSHYSRDVLDRLRAALPLVEPQRQLGDAAIEPHLNTLFSGIREMCRLFAPDKCSSADALLREIKSLGEEYQKLGKSIGGVDSLPQLLNRMQATIGGFRKVLSPVATTGEDPLVCAGRIVDVHKNIDGRIKDSSAFKYLVGQDDTRRQLPLLERVAHVVELAGQVPQLVQQADRQTTQIKTLETERDNCRTQTGNLNVEVTRLTAEVASREHKLGALETSVKEFRATYAETVNGFLRHLSFQPEEADPDGDLTSSLRTIRERADRAMNERPLFKSLRLGLLPGVEQLEKEIAEAERLGRSDVIRALSLNEDDRNLNIVANLRKIIARLESFAGDQEKLWEHGLLDGFASGWLHHLLRADRLLQVYFADSSALAGLRRAVKSVALSFETAIGELGISLFETKLLNPIPADRPVTRTKVGEITKVPEIKEAVEMIRQNGSNFVVDIIHFGLGGRSGVNEEVRIAIMNPVDWA
jgi:hypothetical protein